jgi:hypothetical protein
MKTGEIVLKVCVNLMKCNNPLGVIGLESLKDENEILSLESNIECVWGFTIGRSA